MPSQSPITAFFAMKFYQLCLCASPCLSGASKDQPFNAGGEGGGKTDAMEPPME